MQKGDSLWSIAKRFNVGVNELKTTNNLNSNLISVGQNLVIPGVAPSDQTNITYIVQKGDSLWSIANSNNTTVDELVNLNDLIDNTIYVGQTLQIPNTGPVDIVPSDMETTYIVQKGDTLYSVAKKYDSTPLKIKNQNNLMNDILTIGQVLVIPSDPESTGQPDDITETNTYVVQKGDTISSIARNYMVTESSLKQINGLTSDLLTVGQILTIPKQDIMNNGLFNLYVVQKGDSLWSIANKFGVSINDIRMINNLNTDLLNIGQTLIIP